MEIISQKEAARFENSAECLIESYPAHGFPMDGAIATISGRYPLEGFAYHEVSAELVFVMDGEGFVETPEKITTLKRGDVVSLCSRDLFAWNGTLTLFIVCSPAFKPEQYKYAR